MSRSPAPTLSVIDVDGVEHDSLDGLEVVSSTRRATLGRSVRIAVRNSGGHPIAACVRVRFELPSHDPGWLIPGLFYGENRPAANARLFPRFESSAPAEAAREFASSSWEFRADRAATPAVFLWADAGVGGIALAATESTALGLTGIGLAHDAETGVATAHLTFPYREHPVSYFGDATPRPADVATHVFAPGERAEVTVRVFELPADRHGYEPVLRVLHAESAPTAPLRPWVSVAEASDLAAHGLLRWHYDPDPGVLLETVGFDREVTGRDGLSVDRQAMHVGWVSGIPWAHALLRHGVRTESADETDAARRVIDFIASNLAPCGTFWGVWYRGRAWSQSWSPVPRALHSRTLAEATLFLHRSLADAPNVESAERWRAAVRSNLDAVVVRQRDDGNLGTLHDAETGEVLSWEGAAGLSWVAALAEARALDDRYLDAARRAGEYYGAFVDREFIHGAPEDVDLAPTSEDGYAAVLAYVALYEASGEERWLDLARRAADWMLTFRYSYDVSFPEHTLLGRYDFGTRGADQASPSNQHLHAYGLVCTRELHALARALGDPWYAERADETLACFRQFVAREDGDFNAYKGMVSERYYQTQCFQPKGMLLTLSHAWSVGVLLLGCEQAIELGLPGSGEGATDSGAQPSSHAATAARPAHR